MILVDNHDSPYRIVPEDYVPRMGPSRGWALGSGEYPLITPPAASRTKCASTGRKNLGRVLDGHTGGASLDMEQHAGASGQQPDGQVAKRRPGERAKTLLRNTRRRKG